MERSGIEPFRPRSPTQLRSVGSSLCSDFDKLRMTRTKRRRRRDLRGHSYPRKEIPMLRIALRGFHPKSLTASGEPLGFDYGQKCPPLRMTRRGGCFCRGDHWSPVWQKRDSWCEGVFSACGEIQGEALAYHPPDRAVYHQGGRSRPCISSREACMNRSPAWWRRESFR